ncbi:MAG TPA: universal stress protein [Planctomycetota bacterium]|nr:universal stress protein [Planctomycetota bacterium]
MAKSVVVPLDGSFTAESILPWVQDYAIRTGARVNLVRVIPKGEDASDGHGQLRQRRDAFAYLRTIEAKLKEAGVDARSLLRQGAPARTIARTAVLERADYIALSPRGAGRVARILLGGIAERLLKISTRPLFVAQALSRPSGPFPLQLKKILVPVDGSELSESVLPFAVDLAGWYTSGIVLLHARSVKSPAGDPRRLEELAKALRGRGIPAAIRLVVGDAAQEILRGAKRLGADLIAMNSHGRGGFIKFFLGSVTEEVVHGASVPVLITKNRRPVPLEAPKKGLAHARA